MNLNSYYSLYNRLKTGKFICWGVDLAKAFGIRHLLVRLDTNFICNLRCRTCYFSGPIASQWYLPPMKLNLFKEIAKDVFPKTRILFLSCGAEPFMTKGFENFLEVAGDYSIPYSGYVTNGLLFTESIIRSTIENKISQITISIDGATKETYEYIRDRGKFDILISKLSLYKDIIAKVKDQKPSLRFNFTVCRSNHLEMPLLVDLAKQFGVKVIRFRIYVNWGGSFSFEEESLLGYENSFNESLREAKKRAQQADIRIISPEEFRLDDLASKRYIEKLMKNPPHPPCVYPWFFRYINPLGRVRVCTHISLSDIRLGNGNKLSDIERSEEEVRRKYLLSKNPSESCFVKVCQGEYIRIANCDINFLKLEQT